VRVRQRLSLPSLCEVTLADPPPEIWRAPTPLPGASLRLTARERSEPLFTGEIAAIEHVFEGTQGRMVRMRGYDVLHRLGKRQPVRGHVQVTAPDLLRELVSDIGLRVSATETGPVWPRVMQYDQTDLELVAELCERSGLYFTVRDDVVHVLSLEGIGEALPIALGATLLEARIEVNGATTCRAVSTMAWDPLRGAPHRGSAAMARSGRSVAAVVEPALVGASGERTLSDELAQGDDQADALAQADLDARVGREVVLWGMAEGDPRLSPGTPIEVTGVAPDLVGRYVLTEVSHTIDASGGFISELSTMPPAPRDRPRAAVVTTAVVSRVDDPDRLGRVTVTLPTYGGLETDWMGVLAAGAGSGKGLVMLPDTDDRVLVLFPRGDPAYGVVLGGLYGSTAPPDDAGIADGKVRRMSFMTPGGQYVRLDDARHGVLIRNDGGSYVELTPESVVVHATTDLRLEAPGHAVVVRGQTIDFEQG
jgi:uncharacterized protein involved in type VI secretion and phage assembly